MNPLKLLYTVIDSIKFLLSYPLLSREDRNVFLKAYGLRWSLILILTLVIYLFGFDFLLGACCARQRDEGLLRVSQSIRAAVAQQNVS